MEVEMKFRISNAVFRIVPAALLMLATVGLLAGCDGMTATETVPAEEVPVVSQEAEGKVVAEAVVEPADWSELHFDIAGKVVDLLVQEGDAVAEGDVLARLETVDLERAVTQAELDLRQARVGLSQAELRLEQLQEPPDEADVRQAEHAVAQAEAAIQRARMNLGTVLETPLLNETLEDAEGVYDDALHRYEVRVEWYETGVEPDYWFVDQAKEALDDAKLNLDRIRQEGNLQVKDARDELAQAEQAHQEAQDELARLLEGPDALEVAAAEREIDAARLEIEAAELALEEAQSKLEDVTLVAPFGGTVTQVEVEAGETVAAGEMVLLLATLDQLQVRTVDLTELDVARVAEGQAAVVTVDALPGVELEGHVERIDLQAEDYRGDVTYPVYVALEESVPELRWGMTALVEIEAD
jgi:HlyD family secretion protein